MQRSADVIDELLDAMNAIVKDYGILPRTGASRDELIAGTACFPGGSGLWRGADAFGPLPDFFPESPIMFVAHNFDSENAYRRSRSRGTELVHAGFWKNLRAYLDGAGVSPERCFFSNVLMGLQPGSAVGRMPASKTFATECRRFLERQIEIVKPGIIATLGAEAKSELAKINCGIEKVNLVHPSARPFQLTEAVIKTQAETLRRALLAQRLGSA
jgi:uracil-DNA glycosylase family 4